MLVGNISEENVIAFPACNVWEIYKGFDLAHFINKHLSHVIGTVEFIKGDGGAGSVIRLTSPPGTPGIGYAIERFRTMDDEMRVKEIEQLEGGYLALGFSSVLIRLEIMEKSPGSSIVRPTIEYEIDEELAQNVSLISFKGVKIVAEAVEKHLAANKACD